MAVGHLGEHRRGLVVDRSLNAVLLVCRDIRQLQQNLWLFGGRGWLHDLAVALDGDRPARRRAERGNGTPDRARYDRGRLKTAWRKRRDDGRSRREGSNLAGPGAIAFGVMRTERAFGQGNGCPI